MSHKGLISIVALAAALVLFFAVNIVAGRGLAGARADLTEGRLYTLSQGSKNIAKGINEPITFTLYLTQKAANDIPPIKAYSQRVTEMLREYANASNGKIQFHIVDPEPFSEAEDKAVGAGINGLATGHGEDRLYFGLVGTNAVDKTEIIAFFDPQKEEFLEYDIAKLIFSLSDQPRKTIGVMSWLPLSGMENYPLRGGQNVPPWQIDRRLKESFDVKSLATNVKEIPDDIKVLLLVHPKRISEATQYLIDQFVLRGGRAVVFVDPHCEADVPPGVDQMRAMQLPKASDLPKLFGAWGIEMEPGKIAADMGTALPVQVGSQNRPEVVPYVAILKLSGEQRSSTDPVTGQLNEFIVGTAGVLKKKDGATTDVQPLLMTSSQGSEIDASLISFVPDPKKLLAEYKPGTKPLWIAVRVTGKVKTAFPDGAPKTEPQDPTTEKDKPTPAPKPHVAESAEPINVVVVADCDMLSDRFWIQEQRAGNLLFGYTEVSDNGSFVISALDNLSGSSDLMSLRARGRFSRPFTKIQELERDAQQRYQAKEQELQKKLHETEQEINDLAKQRPDGKDGRVTLTPEQQKKIDGFRAQMVLTRKDLREVKFNLDKDTRSLQTRLMVLNIGLMPVLIGVFALGLAAYRASRRSADRQTASKG